MTDGWQSLFDGEGLAGWHAQPRTYGSVWPGGPMVSDIAEWVPDDYNERAAEHPAVWTVEDGVIVGRQDADHPGWGGYLVSDESFGDVELELEANPDWPADTGIMLRRLPDAWNGFHAVPFVLDVSVDAAFGESRWGRGAACRWRNIRIRSIQS